MKKVMIGILITALLIIGIDIVLVVKGIPTISRTILEYTFLSKWALFPYGMGVLCGHFFVPDARLPYFHGVKRIMLGIGIPLGLVQICTSFYNMNPVAVLLIGFAIGVMIWSQELRGK